MNRKHEGMIHVCLLLLLQWISVAVVIINSIGLHTIKPTHHGFVSLQPGPQDILFIVLGITSFTAASLPLCLQLYHHCRSNESGLVPTKMYLLCEISLSIVMLSLWVAVCSVVITHSHVSSPCDLDKSTPCALLDWTIVLGLTTLGIWILLLLMATFSISRLPSLPAFVLEPNPYHHLDYRHSTLMAAPVDTPPIYTPRSSLLQPPPSLLSSKHCSFLSDDMDYSVDVKYPVYGEDSLPAIHVGSPRLHLSFL